VQFGADLFKQACGVALAFHDCENLEVPRRGRKSSVSGASVAVKLNLVRGKHEFAKVACGGSLNDQEPNSDEREVGSDVKVAL
jgi:hypothetical protein